MSFLFVDRILELDDKQTRGIKFVTPSDEYLIRNPQGEIVLMPAIIGETLGQMCAWNAMQQLDFKVRPVAGMAGEVKLLGEAKIGDCIELSSEIVRVDTESVHYHAEASVAGKVIFQMLDSFGPMLPMETFIDEETIKSQFEKVYRPGEFNPITESYLNFHEDIPCPDACEGYDKILAWEVGEKVVAVKHISQQARYFSDHFPRKPVFPLTLLLNANIQLAHYYLRENLGHQSVALLNQVTLRKIKMTRFVHPGDDLVTTMTIKECQSDYVSVQFRSELAGKRVAVVAVEFKHE